MECWEVLGDWQTPFKPSKEVQKRIEEHAKKGHPIQEIRID